MGGADSPNPTSFRVEPLRALRALRELIANPDDTAQVFTIIESLSGRASFRMLERFKATESGRGLLSERSDILRRLRDRAYLESLPEGSLGRAYLAFLDREGISADGLVEASVAGDIGAFKTVAEIEYMGDRMRDTHDLWHTVTGYQGDVFGEASLLAFTVAQTRNPGIGLIVLGALVRAHDLELTKMVLQAIRDGRNAEFLPPTDWEALLPLPLADVRRKLRIEPVAAYEPVRSGWLRETGQLRPAA